jgi:aspartyl-tRNA(Asn)/glutamyl-tRNA(Gln) amidotransferase subunit C
MATELGPADVARIARLARLQLTAEETTRFAAQLGRILAYAEQVQQVDTTHVPPLLHPFPDDVPHDREDEARPPLPRDAALGNAPDADRAAGLFRVPRVIG